MDLDRWVCLGHFLDFRIPSIGEASIACSFVRLIVGRLFLGSLERGCGIKAALFEHLALHEGVIDFFGLLVAIIKVFGVQNALSILGKFVAKQCLLLLLVHMTHMRRLIHAWSGSSVERTIVLVELVALWSILSMEASQVGSEVGILAH